MFLRYSALATILLVLAIGLTAVCCGGAASTPKDKMEAASGAMQEEEYGEAYGLYQEVLDWKGEGEITEATRFQASLESIKCQAYQDEFDAAVDNFMGLEKDFAEEMKTKGDRHTLAVTRILVDRNAPILTTTRLLGYAAEKYPDKKEKFDGFGEQLKERASTPEEMAELKKLGYL
jgi:hypothetical protein